MDTKFISKKQKKIDDLPQELLETIFHRLPVKSLGRCMCVRKKWLILIKNPIFISSNENSKREINQFSIFWRIPRNPDDQIYIDSDKFEFYKDITLPYDDDATVGSGHGLIYTGDESGTVLLWNPTIRKLLTLPKSNVMKTHNQFLGFGFDSVAADYKLVRISYGKYDTYSVVETFSLRTYSWKIVFETAPKYQFSGPPLPILNNALHWLCLYRARIVGFNMSTEVFHEIELPKHLKWKASSLKLTSVYDQSSIALCYSDVYKEDDAKLEVWVMKEYGDVGSWSKIWKFNRALYFFPGKLLYGNIMGIRYRGEVLWRVVLNLSKDVNQQPFYKTLIFSTDMKNTEKVENMYGDLFTRRGLHGSYRGTTHFEESLILLDNHNAVRYP